MNAAFAALVLCACANDVGPRLSSVTPTAGSHDAMVTLAGQHLCGASGDCANVAGEIALGLDPPMVDAQIQMYSDASAQIVVPELVAVGKTAIIVTVDGVSSNALAFEVLP